MSEDHNQNDGFVTLAYFSNVVEAGMACELLLNNGINASLRGGNFGALDPLPMLGGFSEIGLMVPAGDLERSQELYNAFFESETASLPENEDVSDD
jgi:Putative prokaryotic signal transducing protein